MSTTKDKQQLVTISHPRVVASTFCVLAVASVQFFCHPSVDMVSHLEEDILYKERHQDLDSFQNKHNLKIVTIMFCDNLVRMFSIKKNYEVSSRKERPFGDNKTNIRNE